MERIGNYKILRRMRTEGGAHLYEAVHEQIERRTVIKVLDKELAQDEEAIKRFLNQARLVNLINYPGIASIYEYGQLPDGAPYIVMEFLHGETLRDRLQRLGGRMEALQAMRIARQLASALAVAHAKQVIHRDLKPTSIMLLSDPDTPDGLRVKVLNFGIAKLTSGTADVVTATGIVLGTDQEFFEIRRKSSSELPEPHARLSELSVCLSTAVRPVVRFAYSSSHCASKPA